MEPITDPGLLLKVTPPKLRKSLLVRERLRHIGAVDGDPAVIVVEAPSGYGKTSLIAQWRLDWLQGGAAVGWLNLDAGDSPITLLSGIALGLRRSLGRANFGTDAIAAVRRGVGTASALTSLLAEITEAVTRWCSCSTTASVSGTPRPWMSSTTCCTTCPPICEWRSGLDLQHAPRRWTCWGRDCCTG